jgi:predicted Zn-dependent protease
MIRCQSARSDAAWPARMTIPSVGYAAFLLLLLLLLPACASPGARTLDVHGLGLSTPHAAPAVEPATGAPSGAASVTEGALVDHRLEDRIRRELAEQAAAGGDAVLEMLEPGTSVESRLRFALSRRFLRRDQEAADALASLSRAAPDCALAHVLLGQCRLGAGDAAMAVESFRRAQALHAEQKLPAHPALSFGLACALLGTEDADEGMRLMREELAAGTYRRRAAELLATMNAEAGEFEEALAVLDAVLDNEPKEPALVIAKAEVLGDQLRHAEGVALLDLHGDRVNPVVRLHRRALLMRRSGDLTEAAKLLDELLAKHAEDASVKASLSELQATRAEVENERRRGGVSRRTGRELLGFLRYAPQATQRVNAVRALCEVGRPRTLQHAVRWALRDPDDTVRAVAVQAGVSRCENAAEFVATALQDRSANVRSSAAASAVGLGKSVVLPRLVAALEREADAYAFRSLHKALAAVAGDEVSMPFDAEQTAEGRARVAAEWRAVLDRQEKQRTKS